MPATVPNSETSGIALMKPALHPASLLPNAFERNQTPIIRPRMRAGAPAGTRTRNARPMNITPIANFVGTDGSRRPSFSHIHAKQGARMITQIACTEVNHDDGNDSPKIWEFT